VCVLKEDSGIPDASSSSLSFPSHEVNDFALSCAPHHDVLLATGPKAKEPTDHELKPLKLSQNQPFISSLSWVFVLVTESWTTDLPFKKEIDWTQFESNWKRGPGTRMFSPCDYGGHWARAIGLFCELNSHDAICQSCIESSQRIPPRLHPIVVIQLNH
jgi:hypothetical protein